jgi:hypothetical protein
MHLTWFKRNGALNHLRFKAATNPTWFVARPARLERATCGFVVKTFEFPNLLKVKEVFGIMGFSFFLFFPVLACFSIFWNVFLTQILTQ